MPPGSKRKHAGAKGNGRKNRTKPTETKRTTLTAAQRKRAVQKAESKARATLKDPQKARRLALNAEKILSANKAQFSGVLDDLTALIRMIKAYASGRYRDVPWTTLVAATAAVIYVVTPVDLIPDVVPGVGFLDDAAVVAFVLGAITVDLDAFKEWERQGSPAQGSRRR